MEKYPNSFITAKLKDAQRLLKQARRADDSCRARKVDKPDNASTSARIFWAA